MTTILDHFLGSEADHLAPQRICKEKTKYTGSHSLLTCLNTKLPNQNCLQMCSSCPSLKSKLFFFNADINVIKLTFYFWIIHLIFHPSFCPIAALFMFTGLWPLAAWPRDFSCLTQLSTKFQLLIKTKIPTNEEVSCFKSHRCCIYHAN